MVIYIYILPKFSGVIGGDIYIYIYIYIYIMPKVSGMIGGDIYIYTAKVFWCDR